MSSFTSLIIEDLDGTNFRVVTEFDYHVGDLNSTEVIRVPAGFVTDFASTPQFLWDWFPKEGRWDKAAALHDYLYRVGAPDPYGRRYIRAYCDWIFLEAMAVLGVPLVQRWIMWAGVRLGGKGSYMVPPMTMEQEKGKFV